MFVFILSMVALVAADATGRWTGRLIPQADGDPGPALLVLKQDGNKLTGTAGPDADQQSAIENGKVEDGSITFEMPRENGTMKFVLKLEGDSIQGEVSRERDGGKQMARLEVKREK